MQRWLLFLARYILAAVLGTTVVHFGTPQARKIIQPETIEALSRRVFTSGRKKISKSVETVKQEMEAAQQVSARRPAVHQTQISASRPATASPVQQRNAVSSAPTWAVVNRHKAPHYDRSGKNRGQIPVSTMIKINDIQNNRGEELVIGQRLGLSATSPIIVLRKNDVMLLTGDPSGISSHEKQLRGEQARLQAEIAEREIELKNALRPGNPHADNYRQARNAYHEYGRKVRELTTKRDQATGVDRMDYADKLRMMLHDSKHLKAEYETHKQAYDQWNTANPANDSGYDDKLESYRSALAAIEEELDS